MKAFSRMPPQSWPSTVNPTDCGTTSGTGELAAIARGATTSEAIETSATVLDVAISRLSIRASSVAGFAWDVPSRCFVVWESAASCGLYRVTAHHALSTEVNRTSG